MEKLEYEGLKSFRSFIECYDMGELDFFNLPDEEYFELTDLSPIINNLCLKYKIVPIIKYDKEIAKMYIINAENPKRVIGLPIKKHKPGF